MAYLRFVMVQLLRDGGGQEITLDRGKQRFTSPQAVYCPMVCIDLAADAESAEHCLSLQTTG